MDTRTPRLPKELAMTTTPEYGDIHEQADRIEEAVAVAQSDAQLVARLGGADAHGGFVLILPNGDVVRAYNVFAIAVDAGQRLIAVEGVTLTPADAEEQGLLIESARTDNQGDVHLVVWGPSRMFEIVVAGNDQVRVINGR